ncbi:28776_t:CDS:1, partial [Dentiscutata erythropus]
MLSTVNNSKNQSKCSIHPVTHKFRDPTWVPGMVAQRSNTLSAQSTYKFRVPLG